MCMHNRVIRRMKIIEKNVHAVLQVRKQNVNAHFLGVFLCFKVHDEDWLSSKLWNTFQMLMNNIQLINDSRSSTAIY